jgi:hypothetical protein
MLFVESYESQSFFITPAALAVTEPRPATIADQRWIFQMNGVALITVHGQANGDWFRDRFLSRQTSVLPLFLPSPGTRSRR